MRKNIRDNSLGEFVAELARESTGPRKLSGQTKETGHALYMAADRLQLGLKVSQIHESGNAGYHGFSCCDITTREEFWTELVTVVFKPSKEFSSLETCVPILRMSEAPLTQAERVERRKDFGEWLLTNPKYVHIPKVTPLPWKDEQPTTYDLIRFFPYSDLTTREEITLAPCKVQPRQSSAALVPAGSNHVRHYRTLGEAFSR